MALKDLKMDYRTNKDIIEKIVLNSSKWGTFSGKRIFLAEQMYLAVSNDNGESCYEVKVTTKKDRIEEGNHKITNDDNKNLFLDELEKTLNFIYPRTFMHDGALVINDDLKDYAITLVKKKQCKWNK